MQNYRKLILRADIIKERGLGSVKCKSNALEIIKGHISRDYVHIVVSIPPHIYVSQLVKSLNGKTSRKMMMKFKTLSRTFWGRSHTGAGVVLRNQFW